MSKANHQNGGGKVLTPEQINENRTNETLSKCAERINASHQTAVEANQASEEKGKEAVKAVITAGKNLIAAKAMVKHGEWLKWVAENCPTIGEDTCERYRKLAAYANSAHKRNLDGATSLRQAYIIARAIPKTKGSKKKPGGGSGATQAPPTQAPASEASVKRYEELKKILSAPSVPSVRSETDDIPLSGLVSLILKRLETEDEKKAVEHIAPLVKWYLQRSPLFALNGETKSEMESLKVAA